MKNSSRAGLLVLLTLFLAANSFDMYVIRHGSRAPLDTTNREIFGVPQKMLTEPGKSQAFFYGIELRKRHPTISSEDMQVFSTQIARTIMTAEYFLHGWFGKKKPIAPPIKPSHLFFANPRYLPPCNLSFAPYPLELEVYERKYANIIQTFPTYFKRVPADRELQPHFKAYQHERLSILVRQFNNTSLCDDYKLSFNKVCNNNLQVDAFSVADTTYCLEYVSPEFVPQLLKKSTAREIEIAKEIVDVQYQLKYSPYSSPIPPVMNFLIGLRNMYREGRKRLILNFNHDVFIFGVIRVLVGYEGFVEIFKPHVMMPFLSSLHFSISSNKVGMFFNDQELYLPHCNRLSTRRRCDVEEFFELVNSLTRDYE